MIKGEPIIPVFRRLLLVFNGWLQTDFSIIKKMLCGFDILESEKWVVVRNYMHITEKFDIVSEQCKTSRAVSSSEAKFYIRVIKIVIHGS